ncbi:putative protein kinase [Trypanosoma conorhini]|uniref:non-specific serine/threonine protein kinase n=1 Tax=Trypanosoma conorhini TaxID=83891 RepID=A0A422PL57_9TRYP|nr:putative protein kinase [Trypanosoma conorhini]RNF18441.1 putative protein kinase [Trypanosoma conorhini]
MPAHAQGLPPPNMNWLEVWRTTHDSTVGNLGVACALEPVMEQLRWTREQNMMYVYGGGGRRASQLLASGVCGGAEVATPDSVRRRPTGRPVNPGTPPTPISPLSGKDEITPINSNRDHDDGGPVAVPRISGFSALVRQWETQAAFVVASNGHRGRRRRRVGCDSDDSPDAEDNDEEGDAALPEAEETARPSHSGGPFHLDYSASRDVPYNSGEDLSETQEDVEEEAFGDKNCFGKNGYLACVPGDVFQNRFALVRQLGCGRSSRVWLAVDLHQFTVSRRQLIREIDEHQLCMHFSSLDQPLLVAIKVFRCGSMYEELAEREALVLAYIREFKKAVWLQRQVSLPFSGVDSHEMSTVHTLPAAPTGDGSPANFSGCSRHSEGDSQSNSEEVTLPSTAGHLPSMRDRFTHQGASGVHHCIVMDAMGVSLEEFVGERGPGGVPVSAASGIIRSVLECLALLATMHILHTDVKPANILFPDCEAGTTNGLKTFLAEHFGDSASTGSKLRASHGRASTTRSSRTGAGESPVVSPRPSWNDIVETPRTGRYQSACNTSRQLFKGASPSWARGKPLYAVQLADFDHAMMLPPSLRHGHDAVEKDGPASCRKFRENTVDEAGLQAQTSTRPVGDSVSALSVSGLQSPGARGRMSSLDVSRQLASSLHVFSPSMCTTSLVDDLERDLLSRHDYKRGVLLQSREYRSPEIILGKDYNATLDIWSVGCIAFELLFDRPLFDPVRDFMEASEREKEEQAATPCEREQNPSIAAEVLGVNGAGAVSAERDKGRTPHAFWSRAVYFDEREKNIDVYHLRSIILLLGAPAPRYILATPLGEYVREFFDSHGRFLFLGKSEQMQMYSNDSGETNSLFLCTCLGGDASEEFSEAAHEVKSADVSLGGSSTRRRVSAAHSCCRRATPAWQRLREQIQRRLGKEEGAAFEDFLRRCLQWNPEERQGAHALLRAQWVAAAEGAASGCGAGEGASNSLA